MAPPSAGGIAFLALEDRWGLINVVLHPEVYEASRPALRGRDVWRHHDRQDQQAADRDPLCRFRAHRLSSSSQSITPQAKLQPGASDATLVYGTVRSHSI